MKNDEYNNLSQEAANYDKQFDKILKMNTESERRKIAAMAMQGFLANSEMMPNPQIKDKDLPKVVAYTCVRFADALIAELNKKKDGNN